ncbi:hypothetical protein AYI81_13835 [Shewanella algae]|nr:hypothetical protein AYI80_10675 [Shewanella algae]TXS85972.1 hypothetical protein AYI81_13835 [Shewanella algae]
MNLNSSSWPEGESTGTCFINAVIEGGVLKTDLSISWPRHGILSFSKAPFKPRQGERNLPRIMGVSILLSLKSMVFMIKT